MEIMFHGYFETFEILYRIYETVFSSETWVPLPQYAKYIGCLGLEVVLFRSQAWLPQMT
jgi:hypothetical protein